VFAVDDPVSPDRAYLRTAQFLSWASTNQAVAPAAYLPAPDSDPAVSVVAVRPYGMNRPITMAALPCRSSACSAFSFAVAGLPFLIRPLALRPT